MEREVGGGMGMGIHVNPWLIHVNVWQKPLQYCKVISLQLIKINEKKKKSGLCTQYFPQCMGKVGRRMWFIVYSSIPG